MQTKKQYLVSIGELPSGSENVRGRVSVAHEALCAAAAAKGIAIKGYAVSTSTATADKPAETTVKKVDATNVKVIAELPDYRYPEAEFVAIERRNGKRVERGMREICRHSMVSLVVCPCDNHQIVAHDARGDVPVTIERKRDSPSQN